jgi:hypothetical protein
MVCVVRVTVAIESKDAPAVSPDILLKGQSIFPHHQASFLSWVRAEDDRVRAASAEHEKETNTIDKEEKVLADMGFSHALVCDASQLCFEL